MDQDDIKVKNYLKQFSPKILLRYYLESNLDPKENRKNVKYWSNSEDWFIDNEHENLARYIKNSQE